MTNTEKTIIGFDKLIKGQDLDTNDIEGILSYMASGLAYGEKKVPEIPEGATQEEIREIISQFFGRSIILYFNVMGGK